MPRLRMTEEDQQFGRVALVAAAVVVAVLGYLGYAVAQSRQPAPEATIVEWCETYGTLDDPETPEREGLASWVTLATDPLAASAFAEQTPFRGTPDDLFDSFNRLHQAFTEAADGEPMTADDLAAARTIDEAAVGRYC